MGRGVPDMNGKRVVVAIDGPAGAGKSTLAKRVATKLGYIYINSGAMYRAIALWALRLGTELGDMHRLAQLAREAALELTPDGRTILNGEDVSDAIREPRVSTAASEVSVVPEVRRALLAVQRGIAEKCSVVMEGRDIGSVVFPEAEVKIFLDADPKIRAERRAAELEQGGQRAQVSEVEAEIGLRDSRDRQRKEAPLLQAPDAQLVDTTGLTIDQVEEAILRIVRAKISNGSSVAGVH